MLTFFWSSLDFGVENRTCADVKTFFGLNLILGGNWTSADVKTFEHLATLLAFTRFIRTQAYWDEGAMTISKVP